MIKIVQLVIPGREGKGCTKKFNTSSEEDDPKGPECVIQRKFTTPAQDLLFMAIPVLENKLNLALMAKDAGFADSYFEKEI